MFSNLFCFALRFTCNVGAEKPSNNKCMYVCNTRDQYALEVRTLGHGSAVSKTDVQS